MSPELQAPPKTQPGACHGQPAGRRAGAAGCERNAICAVRCLTAPGSCGEKGKLAGEQGTRSSDSAAVCQTFGKMSKNCEMMNRKPEMHIKRVRAQGYTQGCIKPTTFIQVHEQADDCLRISFAALNLCDVALAQTC